MKVESIEIENYKSIATRQKLYLSDGVTTVIGKNESGKSNLLEAIGNISINTLTDKKLIKKENSRRLNENTIVRFNFQISDTQKTLLQVNSSKTIIEFNTVEEPFSGIVKSGFHKEYFLQEEYKSRVAKIKEIVVENVNRNQSLYNTLINKSIPLLESLEFYHRVSWKTHIEYLKKASVNFSEEKIKTEYLEILSFISEHIKKIYEIFPLIFNYNEENLKTIYSFKKEDFENLESKHGQVLLNFLNAIGFSESELYDVIFSHSIARKRDLKDKLASDIKNYINLPFQNFYNQEQVELVADVSSNALSFLVKSSSSNIDLRERSDGLKWYLNLFIALEATKKNSSANVFFVIDEPGVYLHVDAQRELLRLFKNLSEKNQVLYTTHSPFMIDEDSFSNIRVTQKDNNSDTEIINNVFSDKISNTSKREALSPLLSSIGMSGGHILGINRNKINVITEGIIDMMYLDAMSELLKIDKFVFIPSVGAPNIHNIALILWGWNLDNISLFDYDPEGKREEKKIKERFNELNTINLSVTDLGDNIEIEDLFDLEDYQKWQLDKKEVKGESKKLYAKRISDLIRESPAQVSDRTRDNFKILFENIEKELGRSKDYGL